MDLKEMIDKAHKYDDSLEFFNEREKHTKGYMYDSLCYRYQLARYKAMDKDIEMYHQRMKQALANIPKVQAQRMSKVSQTANEKRAKEDFVSNFRENYGFGRNRTR